jgi:hypothetical protein
MLIDIDELCTISSLFDLDCGIEFEVQSFIPLA